MSALSSRIARSRYFSRISSSVVGMVGDFFDGTGAAPFDAARLHQLLPAARLRRGRPPRTGFASGTLRFAAFWRPFVCSSFSACT